MSAEADTLRGVYAAFNSGEADGLDWIDPEILFIQPDEAGGGQGTYHGVDGFLAGVGELTSTFEDFRIEVVDILDVRPGLVAALVRLQGHGRGSGVPIDQPFAHLVEFRAGRVVRWEARHDYRAALAELGVEAADRSP